jgi:hypothetical protein
VNPERVIVSWITNASFAVAAKGRILLLDTFVTRLENPSGRTPFTIWKVGLYDALRAPSGFSSSSPNGATDSQIPQSEWPQTMWLVDPNDYLRPIAFNLSDDRGEGAQ